MGLMVCPECRAQVSERARRCPRCGCEFEDDDGPRGGPTTVIVQNDGCAKSALGCLGALALGAVAVVVVLVFLALAAPAIRTASRSAEKARHAAPARPAAK